MSSASSAPACVVVDDDGDGTTTTTKTATIVAAWPPTTMMLSSVISSSRLAFFGSVDDPSYTTSALHDSCLMGLGIPSALYALLWVSTIARERERVSTMMHACIHTIALTMGDRTSFHPPPLSLSTPALPSPRPPPD